MQPKQSRKMGKQTWNLTGSKAGRNNDKIPPDDYNNIKIFANLLTTQGQSYCETWDDLFKDLCRLYRVNNLSKDCLAFAADNPNCLVSTFEKDGGRWFMAVHMPDLPYKLCDKCTRIQLAVKMGVSFDELPNLCCHCKNNIQKYMDSNPDLRKKVREEMIAQGYEVEP